MNYKLNVKSNLLLKYSNTIKIRVILKKDEFMTKNDIKLLKI
tara:strand:- start:776 stop:901 length:126 start_codon:yes stop_codon:yes gene_type:complete